LIDNLVSTQEKLSKSLENLLKKYDFENIENLKQNLYLLMS
jgi:hypothetical protein